MIALDTNVLIYACDRADSWRQQVAINLVANSRVPALSDRQFDYLLHPVRFTNAQSFNPISPVSQGSACGSWVPLDSDRIIHHLRTQLSVIQVYECVTLSRGEADQLDSRMLTI
jgi:hypothetical protein